MDYVDLGLRIKLLRRQLHLTQAELAEKANISPSFLGHIERGTRAISLETLLQLCYALKTDPNYLLNASLFPQITSKLSPDEQRRQLIVLFAKAYAIITSDT